jgi:hypothetical protein
MNADLMAAHNDATDFSPRVVAIPADSDSDVLANAYHMNAKVMHADDGTVHYVLPSGEITSRVPGTGLTVDQANAHREYARTVTQVDMPKDDFTPEQIALIARLT